MKKRIITAICTIIMLLIAYTVYSNSFIEVSTGTSGSALATVGLLDQNSQKLKSISSRSTTIKTRVPKSSYQVSVKSSDKSYVAVIKTSGFFHTTVVNAKLVKEKGRKFVGNGPKACTQYIAGVLASYICNDSYNQISIHAPSTPSATTYTYKPITEDYGSIEGFLDSGSDSIAIIHSPPDEDSGSTHVAYKVAPDYVLTNPVQLRGADNSADYITAPYKDGFVLYDQSTKKTLYYKSLNSDAIVLNIGNPKSKSVQFNNIATSGNNIGILYSTNLDDSKGKLQSEVVASLDNKTVRFEFKNKLYTDLSFCGSSSLCLLDKDGKLDVYKITGNKAEFIYSVIGVKAISSTRNGLLVVNKIGLMNMLVDNRSGYYEYTFGDYKFAAIQPSTAGSILSLTNNKNRVVAILVDPKIDNTDSIDKKISELQKSDIVSFVSIYDKNIYISADLGNLVYSKEYRSFNYDTEKAQAAAKAINDAVNKLQIDRSIYNISSNAF